MRTIAWAGLSALLSILAAIAAPASAEDGYELWLRYRPIEAAAAADYRTVATQLTPGGESPSIAAATAELRHGLTGLLGTTPGVSETAGAGALIYGTPAGSSQIAALHLDLGDLGREGYMIRSLRIDDRPVTVIAANSDVGVL